MQFDCECGLATAYEDPPECPECGRRMKHLRLEVLEREHSEFFDRWHDERRKRESLERAILQHQADVRETEWAISLSELVKKHGEFIKYSHPKDAAESKAEILKALRDAIDAIELQNSEPEAWGIATAN